jgi:hypothetical protein
MNIYLSTFNSKKDSKWVYTAVSGTAQFTGDQALRNRGRILEIETKKFGSCFSEGKFPINSMGYCAGKSFPSF